jgi:hypothetical protein
VTFARAWWWAVGVILFGVAAGCAQEKGLSKAAYLKVKDGMSYAEVAALLGEGTPIELEEIKKLPGMEKFAPTPTDIPAPPAGPGRAPPSEKELEKKKESEKKLTPQWYKFGTDAKFMIVGFVNDQMVEKDQNGIFPRGAIAQP